MTRSEAQRTAQQLTADLIQSSLAAGWDLEIHFSPPDARLVEEALQALAGRLDRQARKGGA